MLEFNPAVILQALEFSLEILEKEARMIKWHPKTLNS